MKQLQGVDLIPIYAIINPRDFPFLEETTLAVVSIADDSIFFMASLQEDHLYKFEKHV